MNHLENNQEHTDAVHAIYIAFLIHRLKEKEVLSEKEQQELDEWRSIAANEAVFQELQHRPEVVSQIKSLSAYNSAAATTAIFERIGLSTVSRSRYIRLQVLRIAAAVLLLVLMGGAWLFFRQRTTNAPYARVADILPGGNKATLTLGNGQVIVLDSARNGVLLQQGNTQVHKRNNGQLAYDQVSSNSGNILFNTLVTPKGGQYQVQLPDGSRVWLNAASSLKYPTSFNGGERIVELTGEAYFDIAKDAAHPFHVKVNGLAVKVLGTQFNVMAYADEPEINTTLLEGAIAVNQGANTLLPAPGQQVKTTGAGALTLVRDADIEKAIAWKSGFFKFSNTDIKTLMREIARWYDVEIAYHITDYSGTFGGRVSRNLKLSEVISLLEGNNIHHYKLEGRKLIVLP